MSQHQAVVYQAEILEDDDVHPASQLSRYAMVSFEDLMQLVNEGIVDPIGKDPKHWQFTHRDFNRIRTAIRLKQDLGINLAGAALIIELLERL